MHFLICDDANISYKIFFLLANSLTFSIQLLFSFISLNTSTVFFVCTVLIQVTGQPWNTWLSHNFHQLCADIFAPALIDHRNKVVKLTKVDRQNIWSHNFRWKFILFWGLTLVKDMILEKINHTETEKPFYVTSHYSNWNKIK